MACQNTKTDYPDRQLSQCWVLLHAKNSREVRALQRNGHYVLAQLPSTDDSLQVSFEANGQSWGSRPTMMRAVEEVSQAGNRVATAQQACGEVGNSSAEATQEASGEIANGTVAAQDARGEITNDTVVAAAEEVRDETDGGSVPTTEASEETRDGGSESEESRRGETGRDGDAENETRDEIGAGDGAAQEARDEKSDEVAAKETRDVVTAKEGRGNGPAQDTPEDAERPTGCLMNGLIFATEMCSGCTIM